MCRGLAAWTFRVLEKGNLEILGLLVQNHIAIIYYIPNPKCCCYLPEYPETLITEYLIFGPGFPGRFRVKFLNTIGPIYEITMDRLFSEFEVEASTIAANCSVQSRKVNRPCGSLLFDLLLFARANLDAGLALEHAVLAWTKV